MQFCPFGYFANPTSRYCVTQCVISPNLYADNLTRACSSSCTNAQFTFKSPTQSFGICVFICPAGYFADTRTMSCVTLCPNGTFGSTVNNTCNQECQQSQFRDSVNRLCQNVCPAANSLFGEPYSRTCVTACNSTGYS
ncbi:MAG: hypothetical protein LW892_04595 [Betaproteobacteria bacterium]|nr:hypothetical protein [Betaproteobacteria bacterium]